MSNCNTAAGLLSDLQKLDEAGRDRILNLLSPDNVKDVLKASLCELDKAAKITVSQPQPHVNVGYRSARPTTVEHGTQTVQGQNNSSTKQGSFMIILRYHKRPKAVGKGRHNEAFGGKEIIEISDEESDRTRKRSGDDPSTILPNERIRRRCSIHLNGATGPTIPREIQLSSLPVVLFIGKTYTHHAEVEEMRDLSVDVRTELERRFRNVWSANQHKLIPYITNPRNLEKYKVRFRCIRNMVDQGSCAVGQTYNQFKEPETHADKKCVAAGYPCARFSWDEEEHPNHSFLMCLVPLPPSLRKGKTWTEIGYWVLPEADTGMTMD